MSCRRSCIACRHSLTRADVVVLVAWSRMSSSSRMHRGCRHPLASSRMSSSSRIRRGCSRPLASSRMSSSSRIVADVVVLSHRRGCRRTRASSRMSSYSRIVADVVVLSHRRGCSHLSRIVADVVSSFRLASSCGCNPIIVARKCRRTAVAQIVVLSHRRGNVVVARK